MTLLRKNNHGAANGSAPGGERARYVAYLAHLLRNIRRLWRSFQSAQQPIVSAARRLVGCPPGLAGLAGLAGAAGAAGRLDDSPSAESGAASVAFVGERRAARSERDDGALRLAARDGSPLPVAGRFFGRAPSRSCGGSSRRTAQIAHLLDKIAPRPAAIWSRLTSALERVAGAHLAPLRNRAAPPSGEPTMTSGRRN